MPLIYCKNITETVSQKIFIKLGIFGLYHALIGVISRNFVSVTSQRRAKHRENVKKYFETKISLVYHRKKIRLLTLFLAYMGHGRASARY